MLTQRRPLGKAENGHFRALRRGSAAIQAEQMPWQDLAASLLLGWSLLSDLTFEFRMPPP